MLSIAAVAVSVSLLIVVSSLFSSFIDAFEQSAVDTLGDIVLSPPINVSKYPLLIEQLEQLAETLELKRVVHLKYVKEFNNISGLSIFPVPAHATNNYWLNVLDVEQELFGKDRDTLMQELTQNRIQSRPVWYPNHLQKPYAHCQAYHIDNAERLVGSSLCLPSSSQLTGDDISRIVKILNG